MVREGLRKRPIVICTSLIVISMAVSWMAERVWDTNYIFHRTPIWYLWTVGAGMLMACARDLQSRVLAMAIVTAAVLPHHGFTSASGYILGGSALLLFWPEITVPSPVKTIASEIAGSSMFMYLSHYQVKALVVRLFHDPRPWSALFIAIAVGIIFAHTYNWLERKVRGHAIMQGGTGIGRIRRDARLHEHDTDILPLGLR
jgi:hypothetical protein